MCVESRRWWRAESAKIPPPARLSSSVHAARQSHGRRLDAAIFKRLTDKNNSPLAWPADGATLQDWWSAIEMAATIFSRLPKRLRRRSPRRCACLLRQVRWRRACPARGATCFWPLRDGRPMRCGGASGLRRTGPNGMSLQHHGRGGLRACLQRHSQKRGEQAVHPGRHRRTHRLRQPARWPMTNRATLWSRDRRRGHRLEARAIVKDDKQAIYDQVKAWTLDPAIDVVITTGGTGFTGRDVTPEALEPCSRSAWTASRKCSTASLR